MPPLRRPDPPRALHEPVELLLPPLPAAAETPQLREPLRPGDALAPPVPGSTCSHVSCQL